MGIFDSGDDLTESQPAETQAPASIQQAGQPQRQQPAASQYHQSPRAQPGTCSASWDGRVPYHTCCVEDSCLWLARVLSMHCLVDMLVADDITCVSQEMAAAHLLVCSATAAACAFVAQSNTHVTHCAGSVSPLRRARRSSDMCHSVTNVLSSYILAAQLTSTSKRCVAMKEVCQQCCASLEEAQCSTFKCQV